MLNRLAVLFVVAVCLCRANGDEMFLDKPQDSPASTRYHVRWLTDYTKFPVSFQRQCEAGDESKYAWRRTSDDLLIRPSQKLDSYVASYGEQKTELLVTKVHLENPEELAIYEPILMAPQINQQADHHRDLFTFAYLKSHSILVNKTQDLVNVTCVADFVVPNSFDEDINDAFLAKMEKNAIFKMTMNALNAIKKEQSSFEPKPFAATTASSISASGASTPATEAESEKEKAQDENYVKEQLKGLLEELHKNHHPEKAIRDPSFSQTWTHIQRSNPRANFQQSNKPKPFPAMEIPQLTNQIIQAQKKVQDKLMQIQKPQTQNPAGIKFINPIQIFSPLPRPGMMAPIMSPSMAPMPMPMHMAVPFGMQMPMFTYMHKKKRFAREAEQAGQTGENVDGPEVTGQVLKDEKQAAPEPLQHIRLKYGPITMYRPLRQAEIITCNFKLLNHDDMKIDHQSTIFATVRKDTSPTKSKVEKLKTNPQYEADDEAKWAKELNDITNTLKKKIQQAVPVVEQEVQASRPETNQKLDSFESALNNLKAESIQEQGINRLANSGHLSVPESDEVSEQKLNSHAAAFKKAPSSGASSYSINISLLFVSLIAFFYTNL